MTLHNVILWYIVRYNAMGPAVPTVQFLQFSSFAAIFIGKDFPRNVLVKFFKIIRMDINLKITSILHVPTDR
jgi:hypothetical protein